MLLFFISSLKAHTHYVIIANGPFERALVQKYQHKAILVALDGASNSLMQKGIIPHFILGDFDSISKKTRAFYKKRKVPFISTPDQNKTDIEKGVDFCIKKGAKKITLISAIGGARSDHSFSNLFMLRRYHCKNYTIQIETPKEIIEFLKDESVVRDASVGGKFGAFGFPKASISVENLKWPLNQFDLEIGIKESVCNIVTQSPLTLHVTGEAFVVYPKLF